MRIAVIEHAGSGDYTEYIFSLIEEKAKEQGYQLKTWSNSVPAFQQQVSENAVISIAIESSSLFILNSLYKVKIPSILRRTKAEVVVNLNGIASDKIKIPQLVAAGQFLFDKDVKKLKGAELFAYKNLPYSLVTAKSILVYSKEKMNELMNAGKEKLKAIKFTSPVAFRTFEWHDKIMVKAQQADNKEFFVAVIEDNDVDDFVLLLQAFSKFKKWQQSSMQLLILPKYESLGEAIEAKHKTYKYRDDVRLIEGIEEKQIAAIIASAYAFIHLAKAYANLFILSIATQCSLPIISFEEDDVKEYAGNAGLYCKEKNAEALGNILIQLYKDENLHAQLKEEAIRQATDLNRKNYEEELWQLIEATARG
jgi:glycosyltransferase involved in cell wall biosynthesis